MHELGRSRVLVALGGPLIAQFSARWVSTATLLHA